MQDVLRPDEVEMFAAFGIASQRAQAVELLLLVNLQYSLALVGAYETLNHVDRAAQKLGAVPMGQVFKRLTEFLEDNALKSSIEHAILTRNALVHGFFNKRTAGASMTHPETADAIVWCGTAHTEFDNLHRRLEDRLKAQIALVAGNPDAVVPGLRARIKAIERGEWPNATATSAPAPPS